MLEPGFSSYAGHFQLSKSQPMSRGEKNASTLGQQDDFLISPNLEICNESWYNTPIDCGSAEIN